MPQQGVPRIGLEQSENGCPHRLNVSASLVRHGQAEPRLGQKELLPLGFPARTLRVTKGLRTAQDRIGEAPFVQREACVGQQDLRVGGVLRRGLLDQNPRLLTLLSLNGPLRENDLRRRLGRVGLGRGLQRLDRVVEFAGTKRFPRFLLIGTDFGRLLGDSWGNPRNLARKSAARHGQNARALGTYRGINCETMKTTD